MNIADYDGVTEYIAQCRRIVDVHRNVIIFGASRTGEKVYELIGGGAEKIVCVADNDVSRHGTLFHGIEIVSAKEMKRIYDAYDDVVIIIAAGSAHIIKRQLLEMGYPEERLVAFVLAHLEMVPTPYQFFHDRIKELENVYEFLEDDKSREVFQGLVNFKITMDSAYLNGIADCESLQYFDPQIVHFSNEECFVDCGAFTGDTLEVFAQNVKNRWSNYYCFEADKGNWRRLNEYIANRELQNIETFNVGCWNKKEDLFFAASGPAGEISRNSADEVIKADSLDHILKNKRITFIKMDIEGAECQALEGAAGIIREQKPVLAISIYHSLHDFLWIPQMLHDMNRDYRIFIRHYREMTDSETICYAIPGRLHN